MDLRCSSLSWCSSPFNPRKGSINNLYRFFVALSVAYCRFSIFVIRTKIRFDAEKPWCSMGYFRRNFSNSNWTGRWRKLWDEFNPNLYRLVAELRGFDSSMKPFSVCGKFPLMAHRDTINGRKTFIRGTLDCCISIHWQDTRRLMLNRKKSNKHGKGSRTKFN